MIGEWLWRLAERRLQAAIAPGKLPAVLGDLAEDYARVRVQYGPLRAALWLRRETRSLARAYTDATIASRPRTRRDSGLLVDARHAYRRLSLAPRASMICTTLLAVAIGLFTAMFSIVDAVLLYPAPFRNADRLIEQRFWRPEPRLMDEWRSTGLFDAVEAYSPTTVTGDDEGARTWRGALVTPGMFELLAMSPARGRTLAMRSRGEPDDDVIVSERFARAILRDIDVLGRRITLDGASFTVVGVMPAAFRFPEPTTAIWKRLDLSSKQPLTTLVGRLRSSVRDSELEGRLAALASAHAYLPPSYRATPPVASMNQSSVSEHTRRGLWLLLGGVGLVFVVCCANVATLLLARLSTRQREFATSAALGASRARLLRQVVMEHALIGAAGVAAGVAVAMGLTSLVPALFIDHTLNAVDLDMRALLVGSGIGLFGVVLCGAAPAWVGTRPELAETLRGSRHITGETPRSRLAMRALLVAQIALASSLLVGSTLLVRSFVNIVHTERGLSVEGVTRVRVSNVDDAFTSTGDIAAGLARIEAGVSAWPEVAAVALSREIPPLLGGAGGDVMVDELDGYRVSPAFFDLYRIAIVRGRRFEPGADAHEVIIGERLAHQLWPEQDPIGQRLELPRSAPRLVIGIAREINLPALDATLDRPEFYVPLGNRSRTLYLNLRCRAACPSETSLSDRIRTIHPRLRARIVADGADGYERQLQLPRALAQVATAFTVVAMLTAASGLYSVLTFTVGRRRRELGIRHALGASPGQLRRLVVRDGTVVVAAGVSLGLFGGWMVARSLAALRYGVTLADPLSWAGLLVMVGVTSLVAMWGPARLAAAGDPELLVREE